MPRVRHDEIEFGSDSFLDVVANVVGILVILIIVAGLRAARVPTHSQPIVAAAASPAPIDESIPASQQSVPLEASWPIAPAPPVSIEARAPLTAPTVPQGLVQEAQAAAATLSALQQQLAQTRTLSLSEAARLNGAAQRLAPLRTEIEQDVEKAQADAQRIRRLQEDVSQTAQQIDVLREQVAASENEPAPATEFRHKMTPVARVVGGDELHFRLAGDRVSVVPVEVLALRVQDHLMRHRDAIIKLERFEGTAGPFDGYQMRYLVERQSATLVEELKFGRGMVRFAVSTWVIEPTAELHEETAKEALKPHSRFAEALRLAGPNTSLTFWVYPDSFRLFRRLQEAAHDNDFDVAARPLPFGIPITGSKDGTRSSAQ